MIDPYSTLGVTKTASDEDIKKAYRALAKKFHPDLNPNNKDVEKKFKDISAAYSLLSDKDKRSRYDRGEIDKEGNPTGFGMGSAGAGFSRTAGKRNFRFSEDIFDTSDLFEEIFGKTNGQRGQTKHKSTGNSPRHGTDSHYTISISFMEAVLGARKKIQFDKAKTLEINIPAGITDGQTLRLKAQGEKGSARGLAGDALVKVTIQSHPYFTRDGDDIILELPITLYEAVMGGTVSVPTIHGNVTLKIPELASSGLTLRVKGKGVQRPNVEAGHQYVKLKIVMPETIEKDALAAIATLAKKYPYNPRAKLGL